MADEETKQVAEAAETPAEAEGGEDVVEGEAPAGNSKTKLMMLVGGVVVLLVVGGAAAYLLLSGGESHKEEAMPVASSGVVMFDVPPITVNMLDTAGGGAHFLKAKAALELGSEQEKMEVEKLLPRLQDDWQNFLRQLRPEDVEGSGAMQRLKEALLLRANQVLSPIVVHNVLFRELLVQ
ncbi:MAG: flagellar basal body-associated FliL family protein [Pseudomonadaceae bacterium]|nr:flagellar basal body-associated FliL family protein [Pseudomonadaceae bacterium]